MACATAEHVIADAAIDRVLASAAVDGVVRAEAAHQIVAAAHGEALGLECGDVPRGAVDEDHLLDAVVGVVGRLVAIEEVADRHTVACVLDGQDQVGVVSCHHHVRSRHTRLEPEGVELAGRAVHGVEPVLAVTPAEQVGVVAFPAIQCVVADATVQRVVAAVALERVVPRLALEDVIAAAADQGVVADAAVEGVVARCAAQMVSVRRAHQRHAGQGSQIPCRVVGEQHALDGVVAIGGAVVPEEVGDGQPVRGGLDRQFEGIADAAHQHLAGQHAGLEQHRVELAGRDVPVRGDRVSSVALAEQVGVVAFAAVQVVVARAAIQRVVACLAIQGVIAVTAEDTVVGRRAGNAVVAAGAGDGIRHGFPQLVLNG